MSVVLNQTLGDYCSLLSSISNSTTVWRMEARFKLPTGVFDAALDCMALSSNAFKTRLTVQVTSYRERDSVSLRLNDNSYPFTGTNYSSTLDDGEYHEVVMISDGSTIYYYLDGAYNSEVTATESISAFDLIGVSTHTAGDDAGDLSFFAVYASTDRSVPWRIWDASASDTSNTGAQPVLIETVAGDSATGVNFPTDGTAFETDSEVDTIPVPMLPINEAGQSIGSTTEFPAITIDGLEDATDVAVSISGGSYRVSTDDGATFGSYTTSSSTVQNGYQVQVSVDNSSSEGVTTTATLTVGSVDYTFNSTTIQLDSLTFDQTSFYPNESLTFQSEMLDGTTVTVSDGTNSVTLDSLTDDGSGNYTASFPDFSSGINLTIGDVTAAMTNGSSVSTQGATLPFEAPPGYTEITAIDQSSMLSERDWGYGQSVAVGQIFWALDVDGVHYINNGLTLTDNDLFAGGVTGGYLQDPTLKTWEEITVTLVANDGNLAPTVTIQNTSLSVPYGTEWSDSLLGTITTSDDSDTVTYTVDSSAYIANTAGTYEITVTTSADSGGLTGAASAFVTVEAEVVSAVRVTIPKLKNKSGSNVSASGTYKIYSDIALTSLVATGAFSASAGYDVAWDQEELTSGSTYYVLMYDTNGEFSLRKVVAS